MKVPQYKSQVRLPQATGAQSLTVRANPAAISAGSEAAFQVTQNVVNSGLQWYKNILKTDRATMQIVEGQKLKKIGYDFLKDVEKLDPDQQKDKNDNQIGYIDYTDRFRTALTRKLDRSLSKVTDKVVLQRLQAVKSQLISSITTSAKALARPRYASWGKAKIKEEVTENVAEIALMPEGELKQMKIAELRGTIEYFQTLVPSIGDEFLSDQNRKLDVNIGRMALSPIIRSLDTTESADEWLKRLTKPDKKDAYYKDIQRLRKDPTAFRGLLETLERKKKDIFETENKKLLTELLTNKKLRDLNRDNVYDKTSQIISQVQDAIRNGLSPEDAGWPEDGNGVKLKLPTLSEIASLPTSPTIRANLRKELTGETDIWNQAEFDFFEQEIQEAVTDNDLVAIKADIRNQVKKNRLGTKARDLLYAKIDGLRNNLPGAKDEKFYRGLIEDALKSRGLSTEGRSQGDAAIEKSRFGYGTVAGTRMFSNLIRQGVRPADAFWQTVTALQENKLNVIQTELRTMPAFLKEHFGTDVLNDPANMTVDQVDSAIEMILEAARTNGMPAEVLKKVDGKRVTQDELGAMVRRREDAVTARQRLTAREIFAMESKLKFFKTWAALDAETKAGMKTGSNVQPLNTSVPETAGSNAIEYIKKLLRVD